MGSTNETMLIIFFFDKLYNLGNICVYMGAKNTLKNINNIKYTHLFDL